LKKITVLVVDDSPFIRRIISDWVKSESDLELVGVAENGQVAIEMAISLKPDVITLDVEMPVMDGLTALETIKKKTISKVLMVSSVTTQGADATIRALELGAYDFVTKPQGSSSIKILSAKTELLDKIRASLMVRASFSSAVKPSSRIESIATSDKIVLIACSTGGPKALAELWAGLPKNFAAPILIVQHMPAGFTDSFARRLNQIGTVPCREAAHGDLIKPGQALMAPGGKHMKVSSKGTIEIYDGPNVHGTKPAADPLFLSALSYFGASRLVGAVLTGMGRDGADGAAQIVNAGGVFFGQNEETCVIYGMPKAAKMAGGISDELPLDQIASALTSSLQRRQKRAS